MVARGERIWSYATEVPSAADNFLLFYEQFWGSEIPEFKSMNS